mmetsp:Transcript_7766/g.9944  ORF Transcript_7766/g.9944 Transcript_7766/m.9944 type:complete len:426 (-) Transcript_7766:42-1319(-)|eukprot:CAMPEP_0116064190 /NCGR_PEP_ID=MMETSP0322-20121206/8933_1 /TAXON_ID=163516 /ORGANISM="Leptocylindrus danicus var. apora, Strain B651" /LENGTH=425 /DNA_ID=CAMNT_0003550093 /DNA_START=147 /DNA_END=1424 /DNA_ORIENTATION=-
MRFSSDMNVIFVMTLTTLVSAFPMMVQRNSKPYHFSSSSSRNTGHLNIRDITKKLSPIQSLRLYSSPDDDDNANGMADEDTIQWDLFTKHHVGRRWRGTWTTLSYMGDVLDETLACINLLNDEKQNEIVMQEHEMVVGSTTSDCTKCFDSFETRTIPVANYEKGKLFKQRCASVGMVNGPRVLRSGMMTTELVLKHGDGRVRVIFYHAPAWKNENDEGMTPPDGLKFVRAMYSREADREEVPSRLQEEIMKDTLIGDKQQPKFFRPVPPFSWHKKWGGTSWTWGETTGDKGWMVSEMEEADAWHGRPRGDSSNVWSMRLPGGILIQCPRVIPPNDIELCRLAWLPDDEVLLRAEASISCLEPIIDEENDQMIGLKPPKLVALRCDVLESRGEVDEKGTMLDRLKELEKMGDNTDDEDEIVLPLAP